MEQTIFSSTLARKVTLSYLRYLPPRYEEEAERSWPLILFLHGFGESGDDLDMVRRHGIPRELTEGREIPAIVLAPQCPTGTWWPELAETLLALLDDTIARERVDLSRMYLTGMSMGGHGTWYLGSRAPGRFAALAPVCGKGLMYHGFPEKACALKDTPVWAFHGAKDDVVPLEEGERLVEALRACGGNVRFTVYPEANHDSWTETYANPDLYEWMFAQTL